ncbi:MAG: RusA family crossover junction endodeoxyribonuclease [Treponema sp.]|jgi:Holliday junction resolvase RusA-like endonuclease|nr:RusA family crossover junction endodeoxyribonuclease [Treponema sp.]
MRKLVYSVFAEGTPRPQPRPRKGRYGNFYNPRTADPWKETIQVYFLMDRKPPITGPVYLKIHFFFHKAAALYGKIVPHTVRPDKDNLEKAVMDALTGIQIWKDDCQVYGGNTEKYWTKGKSGAQIWIEAEDY